MNYDDLISRYLDGELSQEDDNMLRNEIAKNPQLKSDFDDAIFVHCALKSDSEKMQVPEDLKRNIQDLVLMKILNDNRNKTVIQYSRAKTKSFAMAVVAVIIFGFSYLSDYPTIKHINNLLSYQQNQVTSTITPQISSNSLSTDLAEDMNLSNKIAGNSNQSKNLSSKNDKTYSNSIRLNNSKLSKLSTSKVAEENNIQSQNSIDNLTLARSISYNDIIEHNSSNNDNYSQVEENKNLKNELYFKNQSENINIASSLDNQLSMTSENNTRIKSDDNKIKSFSYPYLRNSKKNIVPSEYNRFSSINAYNSFNNNINSVYNTDPLINLVFNTYYAGNSVYANIGNNDDKLNIGFSQSIGYSVNQRHKIGLEVGNISYSTSTTKMVPVASGVLNSNGNPIDDNASPSPTILMPIKMSNHSNYIWGNIFYEYNFLQYDNLALNGRIGIGGNKAGLMNLSRLTASYKLLNSINVSVGLDNRLFFINDFYSDVSKKMINSLSIVYGIQFTL